MLNLNKNSIEIWKNYSKFWKDVYGEYEALPGFKQIVDFRVTDADGNLIVERADVYKGDFSFISSPQGGTYTFCFFNRQSQGSDFYEDLKRRIAFDVLTGTETVDYHQIAKKEHLKPMEVNLKMMEDIIKQVYHEYKFFSDREQRFRKTSDSTEWRLNVLSVFAIVIFITGFWNLLFFIFFHWILKKNKKQKSCNCRSLLLQKLFDWEKTRIKSKIKKKLRKTFVMFWFSTKYAQSENYIEKSTKMK